MSTTSLPDAEEVAPTTNAADVAQLETDLNTQRNNAFFSLVRMGHMNPSIASALASTYRAALTCNTYIRQQAEHHQIDTAWLYFMYAAVGFVALGIGEMGMAFGARVVGMVKWLMLAPALGIPVWKITQRRGLGEILEFFSKDREGEGGGGDRESKRT